MNHLKIEGIEELVVEIQGRLREIPGKSSSPVINDLTGYEGWIYLTFDDDFGNSDTFVTNIVVSKPDIVNTDELRQYLSTLIESELLFSNYYAGEKQVHVHLTPEPFLEFNVNDDGSYFIEEEDFFSDEENSTLGFEDEMVEGEAAQKTSKEEGVPQEALHDMVELALLQQSKG